MKTIRRTTTTHVYVYDLFNQYGFFTIKELYFVTKRHKVNDVFYAARVRRMHPIVNVVNKIRTVLCIREQRDENIMCIEDGFI